MKTNLIIKIIVISIIIIPIGYIISLFISYHLTLSKAQSNFLELEFKPMKINGHIYKFEKYSSGCFGLLEIKTKDKDLSYGISICGENSSFALFSDVGDSIIKLPNSFEVIVIKKNSLESKKFDFPFENK